MLRERARASAITVLFVGLCHSATSHAWCRTTTCDTCEQPPDGCVSEGAYLYWPVSCVTFDVQKDASKFADFDTANRIAEVSFDSWNVTCPDGSNPSLQIVNRGAVACSKHEYNDQQNSFGGNANIIVFRDDSWTATKDPHTLALTTVTYNKNTGEIYDADIEVNSAIQLGGTAGISTVDPVPPNSFDLQSILTHEAGHFLGLAHTAAPCQALTGNCPTMDPMYRTGSADFRTLEEDDVEGICAVYPTGRQAVDNDCAPRHGFASECGEAGKKGCCTTAPGRATSRGGAGLVAVMIGLASLAVRGRLREK
jgi:hypothetical protein